MGINTDCDEDEDDGLMTALDNKVHRDMERTSTGVTPEELGVANKDKVRTIFKIPVKDGVTYCNIIAIPLVPMCAMLLSTYLNAQIIFLLNDPNMFDVDPNKIGQVSGLLIFVSLPGAIIGTAFMGYIYEIVGRRLTLFLSFLSDLF